MQAITNYLSRENIKFDIIKNQILVKRDYINYDLRQVIKKSNLNTYELDTIVIIF